MQVQELGQLHRLFDLVNHHLSWNAAHEDEDRSNHEYDTIHPDWSHLNQLPDPSETDDSTYNPSLDEWKEIGVRPTNFLAQRDEMEKGMLELASGIGDELDAMRDDTSEGKTASANNKASATEQSNLGLFGD